MNAVRVDGNGTGRRVLAAVAFADVVNYSAMMAADEARTHAGWMAVLEQVVRPKAADHGGSVVKSTGDGVLARFGSALDAVEWAEDVQRTLESFEPAREPPITLRISIHLGDVISTDDDIFGDGVNVAARLLEHAAPGGIVMSEALHDLVRGSAGGRAVDLGVRHLKSFEHPVRIYHLAPERPSAVPWIGPVGSVPSIAVLPLANLSDDPQDAYFAEGVVEDIIASLAGLGDLLVIASGSTLSLRNPAMDPREVGRLLGVRYVLMGSLRRSSRLIRVRLRLCDASDGSTVWTENAEPTPGELFDMQDSVVAKVISGIAPNIRFTEMRKALRKRPESFTAYDHMLRGMHLFHSYDGTDFDRAIECFQAAIAADPFFAMPFAWAAKWHMRSVGQNRIRSKDHQMQAETLSSRAIELDNLNPTALAIYGHVKSFLHHNYETGLLYLERALNSCQNSHYAQIHYAATLSYINQGARAIHHAEHGLRLSPLDRSVSDTYTVLGLAYYSIADYERAIMWGKKAYAENRNLSANHRLLIGSLVAIGRLDDARRLAAELLLIEPEFSVTTYAHTRQPFADRDVGQTFTNRLRQAGLPE